MNIVLPAEHDDGKAVIRITNRINTFTAEEQDCVKELWDDYAKNGPLSPYRFCVSQNRVSDLINGFACYGKHALTESTYDLYWIAVDPDERRSGVGSDLLCYVERKIAAEKGCQLIIETSSKPDYQGARRFYQRHQYRKSAILRDFYAPGDHLIMYSKRVKHADTTSALSQSPENQLVKPDLHISYGQNKYS